MKKTYISPTSTWSFIGGAENVADSYGNWGSKGVDNDAWTKGENGNTSIWGEDTQSLGGSIWDNPVNN